MTRTLSAGRLAALAISMAVTAAALLCLGGCDNPDVADQTDPTALDGTEWGLESWSESGLDPAAAPITAIFAEGRISGLSGVNTYGGPYTTGPGDAFSVGEIASTMMAGPEAAMEAEAAYVRLLSEAASFELDGDALTLFAEDGTESLVFTATFE